MKNLTRDQKIKLATDILQKIGVKEWKIVTEDEVEYLVFYHHQEKKKVELSLLIKD